jgi:hypothetical protein
MDGVSVVLGDSVLISCLATIVRHLTNAPRLFIPPPFHVKYRARPCRYVRILLGVGLKPIAVCSF